MLRRMKRVLSMILLLPLAACHSLRPTAVAPAPAAAGVPDGLYDNHEQVWRAAGDAAALAPPRLRLQVRSYKGGWQTWRIEPEGGAPATWLMQVAATADGGQQMTPYRARVAAPKLDPAPDPNEWTALDACRLSPERPSQSGARLAADAAACATIAPGIGAAIAFLPIAVTRADEGIQLRVYADQARGPDAQAQVRRVHWYGGWAAVNGAGPQASADNRDWHMNRQLRLGNEGGRSALTWRDGTPSGWSLGLERLTFREGGTPVLKLSIIDDADGRVLAYAWADPRAERIGINLGWIQVGLERETKETSR